MDKILTIIKPSGVPFCEEILANLDEFGKRIATKKIEKVPLDTIVKHYERDQHLPWYGAMIADLANKDFCLAIYEGEMPDFLRLKNNIRDEYANKIEPHPDYIRNVLHVNETEEDFKREFDVWKQYLED